jgi:hypothetical protein
MGREGNMKEREEGNMKFRSSEKGGNMRKQNIGMGGNMERGEEDMRKGARILRKQIIQVKIGNMGIVALAGLATLNQMGMENLKDLRLQPLDC